MMMGAQVMVVIVMVIMVTMVFVMVLDAWCRLYGDDHGVGYADRIVLNIVTYL